MFVPPEGRNLGMVFQSYALWPHMTIASNLALPLQLRKVPKARRRALIDDALEKVGLLHLRERYPHQMSGGQQQRVALARALVYSPRVLLLDEPLSNLDAKLREQARAWLKGLQSEVGITTIYVTHDQEEALAMRTGSRSWPRAGWCRSPLRPRFTNGRGRRGRRLRRTLQLPRRRGSRSPPRRCPRQTGVHRADRARDRRMQVAVGDAVSVAVRPERVRIAAVGSDVTSGVNVVRAQVDTVSYVGARCEYCCRSGTP